MRPTVTGERQSEAGHRQKSDVHTNIHGEVAHEENGKDDAKKRFEVGCPQHCDSDNSPDDNTKKDKENNHPDETPFLGKGGKNKIGLIFGQETQTRLSAKAHALARQLSRTDRDCLLES